MFSRLLTIIAEQLHSRTAFCRIPIIAEHLSMTSFASQIFVFCLLNHLIQKFCFSRRGQWGCYKKNFNWDYAKRGGGLQKKLKPEGWLRQRDGGVSRAFKPPKELWFQDQAQISTYFMPLVSFYTTWKHQKTSGYLILSGGIEKD